MFSVGYNTDMTRMAPKAHLTAPVWNWGLYYVKQVKEVIAGTWKPESYWGGMADGIVALSPLTKNAPEGAEKKVDEMKKQIIAGKFHPFAGPLKDQAGNIKVPAEKTMTDSELLSMDWFVQGVVGKISKK
jgi:basic membrane protein A